MTAKRLAPHVEPSSSQNSGLSWRRAGASAQVSAQAPSRGAARLARWLRRAALYFGFVKRRRAPTPFGVSEYGVGSTG